MGACGKVPVVDDASFQESWSFTSIISSGLTDVQGLRTQAGTPLSNLSSRPIIKAASDAGGPYEHKLPSRVSSLRDIGFTRPLHSEDDRRSKAQDTTERCMPAKRADVGTRLHFMPARLPDLA
jgi:hypothetical protein